MGAIILFDGECNLCSKSVQFIIKRDKEAYFSFASLDSEIGKQLLKAYKVPTDVDSLILIENKRYYSQSSAVLQICKHLHGGWKIFTILLVLPRKVRDPLYKFIANNRYKWFKKRSSCLVPTPDIRKRFF